MNNTHPKVGAKYDRSCYEVHGLAKTKDAKWTAIIRGAKTLADAKKRFKEHLESHKKGEDVMTWLIGPGPKLQYRIVKVVATVEVMEAMG
jgi:hypothetical protein